MRTALLALVLAAVPAGSHAAPDIAPASPIDTELVVRVVGHGSMVLGDDVGGARVTITDVET